MVAYFVRLYTRFRQESFAQLAGSLAFTTTLSVVPFVAIALTVASMFPLLGAVVGYVDNFLIENLLPGKAGGQVARYMTGFSVKARQLSVLGLLFLLATSLMLMFSIEKAFNHLWRVRKPRPLRQRIGLYVVIVIVGPLVAGAIIGTTSYAVTAALGVFNEPLWVRQLSIQVLAWLAMCGFFAFVYSAVPNAPVRRVHALLGGAVATAGIVVLQRLFELYVVKSSAYTVVYGAFAVLPIFLVWIYLCWVVVLVGALVVANFRGASAH